MSRSPRTGFYLDESASGEEEGQGRQPERNTNRGDKMRFPLERQERTTESGKSTPERRSSVEEAGKRSRTSTGSSSCTSCGYLSSSTRGTSDLPPSSLPPPHPSSSSSTSPHSGTLQRQNRPAPLLMKDPLMAKLVPGLEPDEELLRVESPPPYRRPSWASTTSEMSSALPASVSYQCLLSPTWTTAVKGYGSASNSDDYTTTNELLPPRPKSAQEWRRRDGNSSPGECVCVPPVLLSPVLSRPLRSASAASSPLPSRNIGSDSDGDLNIVWRLPNKRSSERSGGSRTNTPTMSPILNRSTSASKLAASFAANRSSSGSGLLSARVLLRRTDSDAAEARRRRKAKRRPSFMSHG